MTDWKTLAVCRDEDPELFFPVGSTGPETLAQVEKAKQVCGGCPVREECLESSLERPEKYGVWGGLTAEERLKLRRRAMRRANAA